MMLVRFEEVAIYIKMQWSIGQFELPFASFSKRVLARNHSNENEFDLHENGREGELFRTKTRFDTEAKGKSKMTYYEGY